MVPTDGWQLRLIVRGMTRYVRLQPGVASAWRRVTLKPTPPIVLDSSELEEIVDSDDEPTAPSFLKPSIDIDVVVDLSELHDEPDPVNAAKQPRRSKTWIGGLAFVVVLAAAATYVVRPSMAPEPRGRSHQDHQPAAPAIARGVDDRRLPVSPIGTIAPIPSDPPAAIDVAPAPTATPHVKKAKPSPEEDPMTL